MSTSLMTQGAGETSRVGVRFRVSGGVRRGLVGKPGLVAAVAVVGVVMGGAVAAGSSVAAAGAAVVTCQGQVATIVATENSQKVTGTEGPDVISTAGFDQIQINAKGGDDLVCTTAGHSAFAQGGSGRDTLVDARGPRNPNYAGVGSVLLGGPDDDRLVGVPGATGDDVASASYADATGAVTIRLDAGTATGPGVGQDELETISLVYGSGYADTYVGSSGDDSYDTGNSPSGRYGDPVGFDKVRTGAGDDHVEGVRGIVYLGSGDDEADLSFARIFGESGDDDLNISIKGFARGGKGNDTVTGTGDFEDDFRPRPTWVRTYGGAGADKMPMLNVYAEGDLTCPRACSRGTINGGSGVDTLFFGTRAVVDLATGRARQADGRARLIRSIERVEGSSEDDVIRGSRRADVLAGGRGRDVLIGRGGNDRLIGGKGRDRADGGPGRDHCRQVETRRNC